MDMKSYGIQMAILQLRAVSQVIEPNPQIGRKEFSTLSKKQEK